MAKHKTLLITTITFFVLVNSMYYWEAWIGIGLIPFTLVLFIIFAILIIAMSRQIYLWIKERFEIKSRLVLICVMAIVLASVIFKPHGLIDFESFEPKDLLTAGQRGTANCTTTFKFKKDNSFYREDICFGICKTNGVYAVVNDTIKLYSDNSKKPYPVFEYGIVKHIKNHENKMVSSLYLYRNRKDTIPYPMEITKNELIK